MSVNRALFHKHTQTSETMSIPYRHNGFNNIYSYFNSYRHVDFFRFKANCFFFKKSSHVAKPVHTDTHFNYLFKST